MKYLLAFVFLLQVTTVYAHKPSDSYLHMQVQERTIQAQWDIALRDLEYAIGIDQNNDGNLTWAEVRNRHAAIASYALSQLAVNNHRHTCPPTVTEHLIDQHSDGTYAVIKFTLVCKEPIEDLSIDYHLFFDLDPQHRGLLKLSHQGDRSVIFSHSNHTFTFTPAESSRGIQFISYLTSGIHHIVIGYDHLLFLLTLLLPAVLVFTQGRWSAAMTFRDVILDVFKIITAFTLAHSLTLALALYDIIRLDSRIVEPLIAMTVIVAALNNLFVVAHRHRWQLALLLGLIHGLGFASVLNDIKLPQSSLWLSLAGFNIGVEIGQIATVLILLPVFYFVRTYRWYRPVVLVGGSVFSLCMGLIWAVERGFTTG